jgi:nucleoside-diphosphate-sugar epimerase
MRVFVTGATGFVGSAIVQELINVGHRVVGLARNEASAAVLSRLGVEPHYGDLTDPGSLESGARACDGVIHTAFVHDFGDFQAAGETDRRAVEAFVAGLAGTGRPLVVTSGTLAVAPGRVSTEDMAGDRNGVAGPRVPSEDLTLAAAKQDVRAMVLRLPPSVHGDLDRGFVPRLIDIARETGVSAYVGDGANRWAAVHRLDAARLYRLALENGVAGTRYHAIGDEGVPTSEIAAVIGRRLGIPVISKSPADAAAHFSWFANFWQMDCPASARETDRTLGWRPRHASLLADLDGPNYFHVG